MSFVTSSHFRFVVPQTRFSFDGATRTFEDIDKVYAALGLINALVIAIPARWAAWLPV